MAHVHATQGGSGARPPPPEPQQHHDSDNDFRDFQDGKHTKQAKKKKQANKERDEAGAPLRRVRDSAGDNATQEAEEDFRAGAL